MVQPGKDQPYVLEETGDVSQDGSAEKRSSWGSKTQFLLATIGYAVGLGWVHKRVIAIPPNLILPKPYP